MPKTFDLPARVLALVTLTLCLSLCAHGSALSFDLDSPTQIAVPGTTLCFTGELTNSGDMPLFITQAVGDLVHTGMSLDYTAFFTSIPYELDPGGSYTGEIFSVMVDQTATLGLVPGLFQLNGGTDPLGETVLGTRSFQIEVVAGQAPEPGSAPLLGAGACFILLSVIGRSRRTNPN